MSRVSDARERLADALTGSGVSVAFGGRFAAPCVLVEPAQPWVERVSPSRAVQIGHKLTAIGGRSDTEGAYDELGELIDATDIALLSLRGVSLPTWGAPHDVTLGNVAHAASVGIVLMQSEV